MEYCLFFDGKLIIIYVYYWKFVYNIYKLVKYVKKNISYLCIYNINKYLLLRFERLGVFIFEIVLLLIVFNVCFVYML